MSFLALRTSGYQEFSLSTLKLGFFPVESQRFCDETRSTLLRIAIKSSFENLVCFFFLLGVALVEGRSHKNKGEQKMFAEGISSEKYLTICKWAGSSQTEE